MYGNGSQFMYLSHQTLQFPKVGYRCQHAFKVRGWQHRAWRRLVIPSNDGACIICDDTFTGPYCKSTCPSHFFYSFDYRYDINYIIKINNQLSTYRSVCTQRRRAVPTFPLEHTTALPHLFACAVRPRNKQIFINSSLLSEWWVACLKHDLCLSVLTEYAP
jgi:hypothetical protein